MENCFAPGVIMGLWLIVIGCRVAWSNKGYIPLAFIDFYLTKKPFPEKIKFHLAGTVFTNL